MPPTINKKKELAYTNVCLFRISDIMNTFRTKTLGLSSLSLRSGAGMIDRLKIPWTYCLSPALIPKPDDWKNHIGLCDDAVSMVM